MLITLVSFAQVKKVLIKASHIQYGTQVNYKGVDVWKMDGKRIVDTPLFIIKGNSFTKIPETGKKSKYMFETKTTFYDDYSPITFTILCKDDNKYYVKIERAKCSIDFVYWNGKNWRLTRYEIESISFK